MRKNTFLIATAVAALTLGTSAFAQQSEKASPGGAGAHSGAAPSHSAQPQNRMGQSQGGEHNRMGQSEQKKSQTTGQGASSEQNRMGQGEKKKSQTTGQAPSEQKSSTRSSQHEGNKAQKPNERNGANQRNERNRGTTGQAPTERNSTNANERNNTNERNGGSVNERNGANVNEHNGTSARGGSHTSVSLSTEQRTKIHSIIVSEKSAPRVAHVDFDVRVGTRVPRGKVHLVAIPSSIIEIQPAWRGFEYFLVGNEIVVVDPASLEIVAVLPA